MTKWRIWSVTKERADSNGKQNGNSKKSTTKHQQELEEGRGDEEADEEGDEEEHEEGIEKRGEKKSMRRMEKEYPSAKCQLTINVSLKMVKWLSCSLILKCPQSFCTAHTQGKNQKTKTKTKTTTTTTNKNITRENKHGFAANY